MSVTAATGFTAAGVAAGLKAAGSLDLALVVGPPGTEAAGVFTTNRAAAAPVAVSRKHLASGPATRAVVLNSGCANAATGAEGVAVAEASAQAVAAGLGCDSAEVLVCSTGPIGTELPGERMATGVAEAIGRLEATSRAGRRAATAIMTTDTRPKEATVVGAGFVVGGMAKGAGMIRPDMATMLALVTTDAVASPEVLDAVLRSAVDASFHALDVDGCPSPNDTVLLLTSGSSGSVPSPQDLEDAVRAVCGDLARQIARDAEGASRVVELVVEGAVDAATARRLGRCVADSALVRAAFYGGDPNWGRILAAMGASDLPYDPDAVSIRFDGTLVAVSGRGADADEESLAERLAAGDFTVLIGVGDGPGQACVLTTDLTPDYARLNGERS